MDEKLFAFVRNGSITDAIKYSLLCDNEQMLEKAILQLEVIATRFYQKALLSLLFPLLSLITRSTNTVTI